MTPSEPDYLTADMPGASYLDLRAGQAVWGLSVRHIIGLIVGGGGGWIAGTLLTGGLTLLTVSLIALGIVGGLAACVQVEGQILYERAGDLAGYLARAVGLGGGADVAAAALTRLPPPEQVALHWEGEAGPVFAYQPGAGEAGDA